MTKTVEILRGWRVFNTHDVVCHFGRKTDVAIMYSADDNSRGGRPAHALVYSPHHKTDPKSAWYNCGNKAFSGNRNDSIPAAKAWAAEHYGITEWATCPTDRSALIPAHIRKAVEQAVKGARRGPSA